MPTEDDVISDAGQALPPELCFAPDLGRQGDDGARRRTRSWAQLCHDLRTLSDELGAGLEKLTTEDGRATSLCEGWDVRDVVVHLVVGDDLALRTLQGEDCFPDPTDDEHILQSESRARVERLAQLDLATAIDRFRSGRERLLNQIIELGPPDAGERVSWASKPISTFSMIQSRLMETWVHGWDLRHPLGIPMRFDDRAWWVADIGVRHVPYSLTKAGIDPGPVELSVSLVGLGGGSWTRVLVASASTASPPTSVRISGPAWAWVVLVSRRWPGRAGAQTALRVDAGELGRAVVEQARAFA
ncbi:maleylpyruvate isomerase N-terminal domain-containing protein [Sphaerimonospora sp. CA-214678]|uniref:maleylpyruvate isomerase N-terminal domain-containing protein n=1 Tax=Sphaerimonospora sp. CA-214678 TaxID=3240029 RepID=UPI003D925F58